MSAARAVGEPRRRPRLIAVAAAGEADQAIAELYRSHYRELVRIAALLAGQPGQPRQAGPADHARSGQALVTGETGPARQASHAGPAGRAGPAGQAEQIVQDAFVALYAAWWQVADRRAALAYLHRSVLAGTRAAARPAVPLRPATAGPPEPGRPEPVPRPAGPAAAGQAALMAAIGALPAGQREALVLALYAGLPMPEIAAAMAVSPDSAAQHLVCARAALASVAAG